MAYRARINSHTYNAVNQIQEQMIESGLYSVYSQWFNTFILSVFSSKNMIDKSAIIRPLNMIRLDEIFQFYLYLIVISAFIFIVEIIWFKFSLEPV